ncbi:TetR/AcrR family transcriptional regulator [Syntrophomonas wolfei]|mgnify:FL=1|uniref:TetR/AcrR family transcriptional regulator n=1 Tax=Syntrophomonas wolfei TaxID=863 RepID=UPI00077314FA|nr:TetR/AcrR family transcriptional regulator [Syntrophomonas wolfei]
MDMEERICNACLGLARMRGLHGFTVDELASQAGISKRTIYRYFRSKDEIIEAAVNRFLVEVAAAADHILAVESDPINIINYILNYLFKHGHFIISPRGLNDLRQYYPHLWQKIDRFRLERVQMVISAISQKEGTEFLPDCDLRILVTAISASIQAVLNPDFLLENGLSFEKAAKDLSRLFLSSISRGRSF